MHGMNNTTSMELLWIHKRRVTHSNSARHDVLFCMAWRSHTGVDEDYAPSTGEGLRTFRCNAVPSSWTVGPKMKVNWPVERAKRPRWLESSPTPLWEFHHHRLSPETSARNTHSTNIWKLCKLFLSSRTVFQEVTKEKGSGFCRI